MSPSLSTEEIIEELCLINPFSGVDNLDDPPRPSGSAVPSELPLLDQIKYVQEQINLLTYNFLPKTFFSLQKHRSLQSILMTAREILDEALPIRCLEATFVGLYLTQNLNCIDRIPLSFKSRANKKIYRHIVLVIHLRQQHLRYGAIGLSRKTTLMYKAPEFHSLYDLIMDYKREYELLGHELIDIKLGLSITHNAYCSIHPCWRFVSLTLRHFDQSSEEKEEWEHQEHHHHHHNKHHHHQHQSTSTTTTNTTTTTNNNSTNNDRKTNLNFFESKCTITHSHNIKSEICNESENDHNTYIRKNELNSSFPANTAIMEIFESCSPILETTRTEIINHKINKSTSIAQSAESIKSNNNTENYVNGIDKADNCKNDYDCNKINNVTNNVLENEIDNVTRNASTEVYSGKQQEHFLLSPLQKQTSNAARITNECKQETKTINEVITRTSGKDITHFTKKVCNNHSNNNHSNVDTNMHHTSNNHGDKTMECITVDDVSTQVLSTLPVASGTTMLSALTSSSSTSLILIPHKIHKESVEEEKAKNVVCNAKKHKKDCHHDTNNSNALERFLIKYCQLLPTMSHQYYNRENTTVSSKPITSARPNVSSRAAQLSYLDLDKAEQDRKRENHRRIEHISHMQSPLNLETIMSNITKSNKLSLPPSTYSHASKSASNISTSLSSALSKSTATMLGAKEPNLKAKMRNNNSNTYHSKSSNGRESTEQVELLHPHRSFLSSSSSSSSSSSLSSSTLTSSSSSSSSSLLLTAHLSQSPESHSSCKS